MELFQHKKKKFYIVSDFSGQGYKDLYMLANIVGALTEY